MSNHIKFPPSSRSLVIAPFVVLLLTTCFRGLPEACGESRIGHTQCCGRQDVVLIRGGLGYWPGAEDMASQFRCLGYSPTIIYGWETASTARKIACARKQGRMEGGVVIVGYSSGADHACVLARELKNYGVRVNTMVLIESTLGTPVPSNVEYCVNFYASRKLDMIPMFRGIPVRAECPCTTLCNINVKHFPEFACFWKRNHFAIPNTAMMRKLTTDVVSSRQPSSVFQPVFQEAEPIWETEDQMLFR